ncbi:MAG: hypothetical protein ABSH05_03315 [Bryobacteraceae bacterium]|jgi:hypothetical protein
MRKKLLLLNLLLLALLVVLGGRVRQTWLEARKRESVMLGQPLKQLPPPPYAPLAPVAPVTAAAYSEAAQQMLFSADRNPTVIVEVTPPPKMPALPVFYGLFILGGGPTAIMSEGPGAKHQEVGLGQKIGEFTLVGINRSQIALEWRGEKLTRRIEELVERAGAPGSASERPPSAPSAPPPTIVSNVAPTTPARPDFDLGSGHRACARGDTAPAGTVADGYRKMVRDGPFGEICDWVAVK